MAASKKTPSEHEKILGKDVMDILAVKSKEELARLTKSLGDEKKDLMTHQSELIGAITAAEEGQHRKLEQAAIALVKEMYPLIDEYGIEIDAHIVPLKSMDAAGLQAYQVAYNAIKNKFKNVQEAFGDPAGEEESDEEQEMKRRISNSLQQGGSATGAYGFLFFTQHLKDIKGLAPGIVDNYKKVLNATFGAYDSDAGVAQMINTYATAPESLKGGESKAVKRNGKIIIQAVALNFPFLVHEIIKGYKSINVGWKGYASKDKQKNQAVVNKVDKLTNEPEDIRWGRYLAAALDSIYIESNMEDPRVRDTFEQEMAKLPTKDLVSLIQNSIKKTITPQQQAWIDRKFKELDASWRQYGSDKALRNYK